MKIPRLTGTLKRFVFFGLLLIPVKSKGQSLREVAVVTIDKKEVRWHRRFRFFRRQVPGSTTTLYLRGDQPVSDSGLIPAHELKLDWHTFVLTPKGNLPAAKLQKGDRVICREKDGALNSYEVGLVYLSKK